MLKIVDGFGEIILTSIVTDIGKINDRFVSVCGQIGVNAITSAVGNATAPPAANEYAVEPVGELKIKPSHR